MIYFKLQSTVTNLNVIARSVMTKQSHNYKKITQHTRLPRPAKAGLAKTDSFIL